MSVAKISPAQKAEIIALAQSSSSAYDIAYSFGVSASRVRVIWYEDRKARGIKADGRRGRRTRRPPTAVTGTAFKRRVRVSPFTGYALRDWLAISKVDRYTGDDPLTEAGKIFADVSDRDCLWCIGRDSEGAQRFCCAPAEGRSAGSPLRQRYCAEHGQRAVRGPSMGAPTPTPLAKWRPDVAAMLRWVGPRIDDAPLDEAA